LAIILVCEGALTSARRQERADGGKSVYLLGVSKDGCEGRSRSLRRAEVLAAAQSECEARGWPWREPVHVTGWMFRFRGWTNANFRDDNPWFVFSRDGRLVRAGWAARWSRP